MNLVVGLGNPEKKYQKTRHNIGFIVIDRLFASESGEFEKFKASKKIKAEVAKGKYVEEEVILAKPQTFMNKSGEAVAKLVKYYKADLHNLVVIHDDIDLPLGKIRISQTASSAGQKGVQDIIDKLGSNEFIRLRIGIKSDLQGQIPTEDFVLQKFDKTEQKNIDENLNLILEALDVILTQGPTEAMNLFNWPIQKIKIITSLC